MRYPRSQKLTHAVFDPFGQAFIVGDSRRDCLLQLIGTDIPDALLESVWDEKWATEDYQIRQIKRITPTGKIPRSFEENDSHWDSYASLITLGVIAGLSLAIAAVIVGKHL